MNKTKETKQHKNKNTNLRFFIFPVLFIYMEVIFKVSVYGRIDKDIIFPLAFSCAIGLFVSVLTIIFSRIGNAIIGYTAVSMFSIYYVVQLVYFEIFDVFLSLVSTQGAGNAMNFKVVMFEKIGENLVFIILLLLPILVLILSNCFILSFKRSSKKANIIGVAAMVTVWIVVILSLGLAGKKPYSPYDLFHNRYILEQSMKKLGMPITTFMDAKEHFAEGNELQGFELNNSLNTNPSDIQTKTDADGTGGSSGGIDEGNGEEQEISYLPQIDSDVDFEQLYNETGSEQIKNLTAYLSNEVPTYTNEYTGMFNDYNVVFVTAESLSKYGISDKCTPTLNKIMNEGFVFDNFYNPRWYHSTIDGEFVNCLSQYPSAADWSFFDSANTYQPYALGNALNDEDYKSYAYHDFDFYYYDRSSTHPNMGYDFKAINYGLEIPYNSPYSDLDTIEAVYEEFIYEDKFNMYFMTFSGHLPYNYTHNAMSLKNRDEAMELTEGMELPETAIAYIAAQMELDKALEFLIEKLEEEDKLDNTVFIVTPDHYPYALKDTYDELAGKSLINDPFEMHRSCLGIWSSSMTEPIKVDKLSASVDVLPTILNLMGVEYDSRLLAGNDILSDSEELVIFSDHSFISDKIKYNATTDEITYLIDEHKVTNNYLPEMIETVEDNMSVSDMIIDTDYFSLILNND